MDRLAQSRPCGAVEIPFASQRRQVVLRLGGTRRGRMPKRWFHDDDRPAAGARFGHHRDAFAGHHHGARQPQHPFKSPVELITAGQQQELAPGMSRHVVSQPLFHRGSRPARRRHHTRAVSVFAHRQDVLHDGSHKLLRHLILGGLPSEQDRKHRARRRARLARAEARMSLKALTGLRQAPILHAGQRPQGLHDVRPRGEAIMDRHKRQAEAAQRNGGGIHHDDGPRPILGAEQHIDRGHRGAAGNHDVSKCPRQRLGARWLQGPSQHRHAPPPPRHEPCPQGGKPPSRPMAIAHLHDLLLDHRRVLFHGLEHCEGLLQVSELAVAQHQDSTRRGMFPTLVQPQPLRGIRLDVLGEKVGELLDAVAHDRLRVTVARQVDGRLDDQPMIGSVHPIDEHRENEGLARAGQLEGARGKQRGTAQELDRDTPAGGLIPDDPDELAAL